MQLFLLNSAKHIKPSLSILMTLEENGEVLIRDRRELQKIQEEIDLQLPLSDLNESKWIRKKLFKHPGKIFLFLFTRFKHLSEAQHVQVLWDHYGKQDFGNRFPGSKKKFILPELQRKICSFSLNAYDSIFWYRNRNELSRYFEKFDEIILTFPTSETNSLWQTRLISVGKYLRIPTRHLVLSWDNLTNRPPAYASAEKISVWARWQANQAVHLYQYPDNRVEIIGTRIYEPLLNIYEDDFSTHLKFGNKREFLKILYLGSSLGVSSQEFEQQAIEKLKHYLSLIVGENQFSLTVRSHPTKPLIQSNLNFPLTKLVIGKEQNDTYISQILDADIVIGQLTSGMLEAILLGRPSVTLPSYLHETLYPHLFELDKNQVIRLSWSEKTWVQDFKEMLDIPDYVNGQRQSLIRFMGGDF